jgi:predicted phosphodiesterase
MLTILHASDLHFGKHHTPGAARAFRGCVDEVNPDLIVLSGDLTQRAKVREYQEAKEFLAALPEIPVVVTPGNHDVPVYRVWERLVSPMGNYRRFISAELDRVTRVPGATAVSLSSAAPYRAVVNGRLRARQLDFAARAFQGAPEGDLRILVTHHNLIAAPDCLPEQVLPGHGKYLRALSVMGVDLILGGHLHRAFVGSSLDAVLEPDGLRPFLLIHSGTTTSGRGRGRERKKNSFFVIRVTDDSFEITHRLSSGESGGFSPVAQHIFPREGGMGPKGEYPSRAAAHEKEEMP